MRAIKVIKKNAKSIEKKLLAENGAVHVGTVNTYNDVLAALQQAKDSGDMTVKGKPRTGYSYKAKTTDLTFKKADGGYNLVSIHATFRYPE